MPSSPPFPIRPVDSIRPLITAGEAYPVMEEMVRGAKERVWMSFRVFDPNTPLLSDDADGRTWMDLLHRKLIEGVQVRVLLSDFDPVGADELHRMTWTAASRLAELQDHGDLEILPLRHEARAGRGLRVGLWIAILKEINNFKNDMNVEAPDARRLSFSRWPGLWRHLRLRRNGLVGWRAPRLPRLYPVSVHQKILVVDDQRAVIGGLDIDERRIDDHEHHRPADQTWHDISMSVTGRIVPDISQHIADTWNDNRLRIRAYFRELSRHKPPDANLPRRPPGRLPTVTGEPDRTDDNGIQLLRTVSRNIRRRLFQMSPRTEIDEIERAHVDLIENASEWLYIETQFFRSRRIADALVEAGRRNPDLSLVMIMPGAPEEIAFEEKSGVGERFGEHLQAECVDAVRRSFGERAAFLSPARPVRYHGEDRAGLHGAEIIYVHSKVAVADGQRAIVGSANLNGRSLKWDTEAAVMFDTQSDVRVLIGRLIRKWWRLGQDDDSPLLTPHGARWAMAARRNARLAPEERTSFLVPYDPVPGRAFGFYVPGLPEELV